MTDKIPNVRLTITPPSEMAGLPKETPILIAFSGGADSRALVHLLAERRKKDGFPLLLAHVDHGIRDGEAKRDREFCETVAKEYGLPIRCLAVSVPALAEAHGRGLEEEAREVRYAFFAELMREEHIPILVTAHHADDNLETVLFRLSRGTGPKGLCGIAPVRKFADGYLVRPLLPFSKAEITAYCGQNGLRYVTDSTNRDTAYSRNRVRQEVIPPLCTLFGDTQKHVLRLSAMMREDEALLTELTDAFLKTQKKGSLSRRAWLSQPAAIRRRAMECFLTGETGVTPEAEHLAAAINLAEEGTLNARVSLSGGHGFLRAGDSLLVDRGRIPADAYRFSPACGTNDVGNTGIRVTVRFPRESTCKPVSSDIVMFPEECNAVPDRLVLRSPEPGDRILIGGVNRRLCRAWYDAGLPTGLRRVLPVLCAGEKIVWAPFVGIADGCRPEPNQKTIPTAGQTALCVKIRLPAPFDRADLSQKRG